MRLGVRQRDHHVAAQEPDRVLHAALLVARARIAEPDLDPMMRNETLKHLHHHDPVPRDPVRRAGGVVEHQHRRHGADVLEHLEQPHGARTPRSPRATPPRTACSNTGTTPPGSARPSGSPQPRPEPNQNPPASRPATTPTPGYPSPGSRCSCLQRFTYRCTIWYEPSNPCSSTSLSYTRLAVCRCLRGMNRSASNHLPINGLYGSSFETAAGRAGGSGEQSSNCAYLRTVCLDTPTSFDMRRQDTPLAPGNPDTLLYGRWHRHVLSFPRYLRMVASTRESNKTGRANASPRRQHDHMVNFSPITRPTNPR